MNNERIELIVNIIAVIVICFLGFFIIKTTTDIKALKSEFASSTSRLEKAILVLERGLSETAKTSDSLSQIVASQQDKSNNLDETLNNIASTVGTLEKLSKTDKELLQKYSKVYFLNENYVPLRLSSIDSTYLYKKDKDQQFHSLALNFLQNMLAKSINDNATLQVVSAYRSFDTQSSLKSTYLVSYGTGANKFSADQGYSEHQLGTAVDLSTPKGDTLLTTTFDNTAEYGWLVNNAYKYGFILSYPKKNAYYQYEPWHWRFVGVQLATRLHDENKNFLILSVHDTGIGISPADQSHVFKRFYRSSNAKTAHTEGMGLGLYTAKAIIKKHGGRIWFTSKGVGQGTTFYIALKIKS